MSLLTLVVSADAAEDEAVAAGADAEPAPNQKLVVHRKS